MWQLRVICKVHMILRLLAHTCIRTRNTLHEVSFLNLYSKFQIKFPLVHRHCLFHVLIAVMSLCLCLVYACFVCLSCSRPVHPTLCLRDMDSHFSRCQVPGGIPYEMPTQNPENLVQAIRLQLGNICAHWSTYAINGVIRHRRIAVFGHIVRLQDSTPAHKTLQSHVNLSLGPPGVVGLVAHVAMDRPNPKWHQPDTCRSLETGPWTRSSWTSDATAHAGYATMTWLGVAAHRQPWVRH